MTFEDDLAFMRRALFWAERGRGRTSPNPNVGAVVVTADGVVVGQGAHLVAGGPHAEVVALDQAGAAARGATVYCTLEPCAHTGRTGPCAHRLVDAGVARVVAAIQDPNPKVAGQGFAYLRQHGVTVETGVGADAARAQMAPYLTWMTLGRPFVIVKSAFSQDGYAGEPDRRVKLTGPIADRYFHRQRAEVDAIAVGSGTVLVDDPLLTARGAYRFRPLTRVIFDWRGRVPASARVFSTLSAGPVIMVMTTAAAAEQAAGVAALRDRGAEVATFETRDVRRVLRWLADRPILSLLVEGGPRLHAAFADAGLVDRAQWVMTPQRLGHGVRARPVPAGMPVDATRRMALGDDLLMEFDVHGIDRSRRTH